MTPRQQRACRSRSSPLSDDSEFIGQTVPALDTFWQVGLPKRTDGIWAAVPVASYLRGFPLQLVSHLELLGIRGSFPPPTLTSPARMPPRRRHSWPRIRSRRIFPGGGIN